MSLCLLLKVNHWYISLLVAFITVAAKYIYLKELKQRRADEIEMLAYLTGKGYNDWDVVENNAEEKKFITAEADYATVSKSIRNNSDWNNTLLFAGFGLLGVVSVIGLRKRKNKWTSLSQ